MTSWRDPILAHFTPEIAAVARLTIVCDPDRLFSEQGVLDGIRSRGFELIPFEDQVAFRFAYESQFRQVWDRGEPTRLVVVLRAAHTDTSTLPYDLIEQARHDRRLLSFSLPDLFPQFATAVVAELDRTHLDALLAAQLSHQPDRMGENATRDFILRHVFGVAPELIQSPVDLLRILLQRHYRGQILPPSLDDRLVALLTRGDKWKDWPLGELLRSRRSFLAFLQERWPRFLRRAFASSSRIQEPEAEYGMRLAGPLDLPFDHDDIRVYMDNLFIEGHLSPSDAVPKARVDGTWAAVGVAGDREADAEQRLRMLLGRLDRDMPDAQADPTAWIQLAFRWAEAVALRVRPGRSAVDDADGEFEHRHATVERAFEEWMLSRYASLHNLAYWPRPVMVHHVPRFLAHSFVPTRAGGREQRLAVVVVDGLAMAQWVLLRPGLAQGGQLEIDEAGVFAWVPTLTSVSRQSIFAGDPPFYFAASIGSTHREEQLWRRFWEDQGAEPAEVAYLCQRHQEDEETLLGRVSEVVGDVRRRIVGIVVGTVDQTLHGTVLGTSGLHASVAHWANLGCLRRLLDALVARGFAVYLTADHGNVEARGIGKPNVGVVADERGERVHVFRDDLTREQVHREYSQSLCWPRIGLPEDYRPLLATGRAAFIGEGTRTVAHGGIALEEVIVPFVTIRGRA